MSRDLKSSSETRKINMGVGWSIKDHKRLERDFSWSVKKSDQLNRKYSNSWIAIRNAKVVAASPSFKGLQIQLKKQNISRDESLIRRIPPEEMKLVL